MGLLSTVASRLASNLYLRRSLRAASLPSFALASFRAASGSGGTDARLLAWSRALVPLAAVAGAALAFDFSSVAAPSLCDPGLDLRLGGNDSTDVVVYIERCRRNSSES